MRIYQRTAKGKRAVVSSARKEASEIGIRILKEGGNAVDAAVAVGFALGVAEPSTSGLGGGGFMLIKKAGASEPVFLDFRERIKGILKRKHIPSVCMTGSDSSSKSFEVIYLVQCFV